MSDVRPNETNGQAVPQPLLAPEESRLVPAVAVFLLALAVRIGFLVVFEPIRNSESVRYMASAVNFAETRAFHRPGTPSYDLFHLPGYPMFLASHLFLGSKGEFLALISQTILGSLTCVLAYLLARPFVPRRYAVAAGVIMALMPVHVYLASSILMEVLFTFVLTVFIALSVRRTLWTQPLAVFGLGFVLGLAVLVRPPGVFLAPVFAMALLLAPTGASFGKRLLLCLVFLLPLAAIINAWAYRNYRVYGFYTPSVQSGHYFLWGVMDGPLPLVNVAELDPGRFSGDARLAVEALKEHPSVWRAERVLHEQHDVDYQRMDHAYKKIAFRTILDNPVLFAGHCFFEFLDAFVSPSAPALIFSRPPIDWAAANTPLRQNLRQRNYAAVALNLGSRAVFGTMFLILVPLGVFRLWRHKAATRPEQLLLVGYLVFFVGVSTAIVGGSDRLRCPLDPIAVVFMAAAFQAMVQSLSGKGTDTSAEEAPAVSQ